MVLLQLLAVAGIALLVSYLFNPSKAGRERVRDDRGRRDAILQSYFDEMNRLILEQHLLRSPARSEVRSVARALTLATAPRLDGTGKAEVVRFLYGAGLLQEKPGPVDAARAIIANLDLSEADLRDVVLGRWTSLQGADLRRARFDGARVDGVDFSGSNLSGASFRGSNISAADFSFADLRRASFNDATITGGAHDLPTTFASSCLSGSSFAGVSFGSASQRIPDVLFRHAQGHTVDLRGAARLDLVLAGDAVLTDVSLDGTEGRPPGWGSAGPDPDTWTRSQQREAKEPCASLEMPAPVSTSR